MDIVTDGSTVTLQSYRYLGLSTIVEEDNAQDGVNLSYISSSTTGDAGDRYVGLNRFGEVVDEKWTTGTDGGSGTVKDEYQYTYDADGNVISETNTQHTAFNENFTYDGLSQLIAVSRGTDSGYQSFTMNNIGDIQSVTADGTTTNRTTNADNQIINIGSATISYDNNGNVTTDDKGNTLVYDAWNRLIAVKNSSGDLVAGYTYDGLGRMTSETDGITTIDFYYSGQQIVEERTG